MSKNVNKRVTGFDPVVLRALHPTHLIKIYSHKVIYVHNVSMYIRDILGTKDGSYILLEMHQLYTNVLDAYNQ